MRGLKRFRGGLVFKAHRLLHHSTLGVRVIKKKRHTCAQRCEELCSRSHSALWYRGGLVFEAHGLLYHSTLGVRVIKRELSVPAARGRARPSSARAARPRRVPSILGR